MSGVASMFVNRMQDYCVECQHKLTDEDSMITKSNKGGDTMQKTQSVEDIKRLLTQAYKDFAQRVKEIADDYHRLGEPNQRVQTIFDQEFEKIKADVEAFLRRIETESAPNLTTMLEARAIAKATGRWR
jgi:deoxyribodipyrimidine photolyase-like uncharacterized protein